MEKQLTKYRGFKAELAIAETFEEIKLIESKAAAVAEFARKNKIGLTEQNEWGVFRVEVEAKKGEWLDKKFPPKKHSSSPMKDEEITFKESSNARLIHHETELVKEAIAEIKNKNKVITPSAVASEIRKKKRDERISVERNSRGKQIADIDIRKGDFKKVLADVYDIDFIITDPPYPEEYLNCFSELSKYASEHLSKDGFIAVYSGHVHIPEVIKRLSEHLTYVWTFCLYHVGKKQLFVPMNIMVGWKPVFIFSKGKKKMKYAAYDVLISEQMEKHSHEWQQSESGANQLIEIFSKPGDLIVDPFSGSGTFVKVARDMSRKSIGAEIN